MSLIGNDLETHEKANTAGAAAWARVKANPFAGLGIVNAIETLLNPEKLVIVGDSPEFNRIMAAHPDPARLDLRIATGSGLSADVPGTGPDSTKTDRPAAYLCRWSICLRPVLDGKPLMDLLQPRTSP